MIQLLCSRCLFVVAVVLAMGSGLFAADPPVHSKQPGTSLADLITALNQKEAVLENTAGMKSAYRALVNDYRLPPDTVRYRDFVIARMLFEATRDAGLWNLHWEITNQEPNSDQVWRQWRSLKTSSFISPTATAECDELSALYAFLMFRAGVHGVGLFWPAVNHTVAVWVLHPPAGSPVRIVVPTTQIWLSENDMFGTRRFNPWTQKHITEYTRRDAPDSYVLSKPLFDFFLSQINKYASASDTTLQRLRYLREGVLRHAWTPQAAAAEALKAKASLNPAVPEDMAALQNFADDMRSVR